MICTNFARLNLKRFTPEKTRKNISIISILTYFDLVVSTPSQVRVLGVSQQDPPC